MIELETGKNYRLRKKGAKLDKTPLREIHGMLKNEDEIPEIWDIVDLKPVEGTLDLNEVPSTGIFVKKTGDGLFQYSVKRRPVVVKVSLGERGELVKTLVEQEGDFIQDPEDVVKKQVKDYKKIEETNPYGNFDGISELYLARSATTGDPFLLETNDYKKEGDEVRDRLFSLMKSIRLQINYNHVIPEKGILRETIVLSMGEMREGRLMAINIDSPKNEKEKDLQSLAGIVRMTAAETPEKMDSTFNNMNLLELNAAYDVFRIARGIAEKAGIHEDERATRHYLKKIEKSIDEKNKKGIM